MKTAEILAEFVCETPSGAFSPFTKEMARRCLLDLLGVAAAGASAAPVRSVRRAALDTFSQGAASVWFSGARLNGAGAALANSQAASAFDLDDGHRAAGGHPGASIIPAALAAAQESGATGKDLLEAVILGYEVGTRVSAARDLASLDTFSTGRWCSYGAAAAAGRLLRLPAGQIAQALAIAGVQSPNLSAAGYSAVMGNSVKEGIPWSTLTGLFAVSLARQGFSGPLDILDHPGYFDAGKVLEGLGRGWAVEQVYFKPYSCCRWIHSAIDGLLDLMERHRLAPGEIAEVEVHTFKRALTLNNYTDPESIESAQYSIPFCLAVAALDGPGALLPLDAATLGRPGLIAFARRVNLHLDPDLEGIFPALAAARLRVKAKREIFEIRVDHAKGDPANPMGPEALKEKFRKLTSPIFGLAEKKAAIEAVETVEEGGLPILISLLDRSLL